MKRSINIISTWIGVLLGLVIIATVLTIPTQYLWNYDKHKGYKSQKNKNI